MTNTYHATPYDISAMGFYFNTHEEYAGKSAAHRNAYGDPVEEFEIQFIDGDNYGLFEALGINQANLSLWFDRFENLDGHDEIKVIYLADNLHCAAEDILDKLDDVDLFEGSAEDYAENYIEECGLLDQMPEALRCYFNTEAFARDMILSGDITEVNINNATYVVWGA